jgi:DNA-binding NarL/FixJ family response regulator
MRAPAAASAAPPAERFTARLRALADDHRAVGDTAVEATRSPGQAAVPAPDRAPGQAPTGTDDLTPREVDMLRLIAAGQSNREIARTLFVSEATVKTHVFAKTGSRDRIQAIHYAYSNGYADPGR